MKEQNTKGRAFRRFKRDLKKKKFLKVIKSWKVKSWKGTLTEDKVASKMTTTPHMCSCHMCGNPRHHFNTVTIQEKKQEIKEREKIMDDDDYQSAEEDLWSDGVDATDDMVQEHLEDMRRNS